MDGENNGKRYEQMDDLGVTTPIFGSTPICLGSFLFQPSTDPKIQKDDMFGWCFLSMGGRINNHPWYLCLEHKLGFVFRWLFFFTDCTMGFITIKASSGKNMFGTFSKHHGQANPSKSKMPWIYKKRIHRRKLTF